MRIYESPHQQRFIKLLLIILTICLGFYGCGIGSAIEKIEFRIAEAIHSMDKAIASLNQQSANWQTVITDLQEEISADMQSTISTEVQNLTRNAVLTAGGEVRCNAEFLRLKIRRELIDLRNYMAQELNLKLVSVGLREQQFEIIQQTAPEPFICDIVPSAVDLSLDNERRMKIDIYGFDLRSMPIYVSYRSYGIFKAPRKVGIKEFEIEMAAKDSLPKSWTYDKPMIRKDINMKNFTIAEPWKLFNRDISSSLAVLSDFHAVLDLTRGGADLPPNASVIVLSWNNLLQSEIPILTHTQILDCNTISKPLPPNLAQTYIPPHEGDGDRDFDGNGPCMMLSLRLDIDASRKSLIASIYLDAYECKSDWTSRSDYTEAYGSNQFTLFTVGEDETIVSFDAQSYLYDKHYDNSYDPFITYHSGNSPIEKIEWVGDTDDIEAGSSTGVTITFRQFNVNVQKCIYK